MCKPKEKSNPDQSEGNKSGENGVSGIHLFTRESHVSHNTITGSIVAGGSQRRVSNSNTGHNPEDNGGFVSRIAKGIMSFLRTLLFVILLLVAVYIIYLLFQGKLTWQEFQEPFMKLAELLIGMFS